MNQSRWLASKTRRKRHFVKEFPLINSHTHNKINKHTQTHSHTHTHNHTQSHKHTSMHNHDVSDEGQKRRLSREQK